MQAQQTSWTISGTGHGSDVRKSPKKKDGSNLNVKEDFASVARRLGIKPREPNSKFSSENNQVATIVEPDKAQPQQQASPSPITTVVRKAGHMCSILSCSLVVGGGELPIAKVSVDNHDLEAILDTGAHVSAIHADHVNANKWNIKPSNIQLIGANNSSLSCNGTIHANLVATLGQRRRLVTHDLVVVDNLCAPMLLGWKLIQSLEVIIDPTHSSKVYFRKESFSGLSVTEPTILAPSS